MKRIILIPILLFVVLAAAWGQAVPAAVLEYVDDEFELAVFDRNSFEVNFYLGMTLSPGDRIETAATGAEIRLQPNGSIIRVAPNTVFVVGSIQDRDGATSTNVAVNQGRVRMVAARVTGRAAQYEVRTPTAVAGVRGTDFGVTVGGDPALGTAVEELFVFEGEVAFQSAVSGQEILVGAGQRADAFAANFAPVAMTTAELAERLGGLEFTTMDPADVPGSEAQQRAIIDTAAAVPVETPPEEQDETGAGDRLFERLAGITGLEVGSVTINNETYARVVFQPRIQLGKLAAQFYLPITYRDNLFDTGTWYRPAGNNEWSFGSDQDWSEDPLEALRDLGTDLALKIRFLEYGQQDDPFFFKVGNVSNLTIGNGLLMDRYANDADFPTVRRLGFNLGIDRTHWGFESVADDLLNPEIMGGRLYFRPAAPVTNAAVGITGLVDIGPARGVAVETTDTTQRQLLQDAKDADPLFLNVGMDLTVPVVRRETLRVYLFGEAGGMIPYVREEINGVDAGIKTDALVDFENGEIRNFGWQIGTRGRLLILDYLLAFRSFDGTFRPGFYDAGYDRLRATYAAQTIEYLRDPLNDSYRRTTMGVQGRAGAELLGLVKLSAGYFWPWEITSDGDWRGSSDDELVASVELMDGLAPFGITAGLQYRRTHFAATLAGWGSYNEATLFDAYTNLDGFVAYPLTPQIDLVARVSTAVQRDGAGNIVYDQYGRPKIAPVVVVQTQIGL